MQRRISVLQEQWSTHYSAISWFIPSQRNSDESKSLDFTMRTKCRAQHNTYPKSCTSLFVRCNKMQFAFPVGSTTSLNVRLNACYGCRPKQTTCSTCLRALRWAHLVPNKYVLLRQVRADQRVQTHQCLRIKDENVNAFEIYKGVIIVIYEFIDDNPCEVCHIRTVMGNKVSHEIRISYSWKMYLPHN